MGRLKSPYDPSLSMAYHRKDEQNQESAGSITFGRHVQIPIKIIYLESSHLELSLRICMGPIGGGGAGGDQSYSDPPSEIYWATSTKF